MTRRVPAIESFLALELAYGPTPSLDDMAAFIGQSDAWAQARAEVAYTRGRARPPPRLRDFAVAYLEYKYPSETATVDTPGHLRY